MIQGELSEAEKERERRVQALLDLQPTHQELKAVADVMAERERKRREELGREFAGPKGARKPAAKPTKKR